jgi:hypothetical protein
VCGASNILDAYCTRANGVGEQRYVAREGRTCAGCVVLETTNKIQT